MSDFPADLVTYNERRAYLMGRDSLLPLVKRCAFLLNSARLVIEDDAARGIAGEAVEEARQVLAEREAL